jgi:hypothetical protein
MPEPTTTDGLDLSEWEAFESKAHVPATLFLPSPEQAARRIRTEPDYCPECGQVIYYDHEGLGVEHECNP